jgi:stress-induced morphogen
MSASTLAAEIEARVRAALTDVKIELQDTTGGGDHWAATIVSPAFHGKNPVERHRLIYAALGELMRGPIHALALTTETPEEYKRT